MVEEIKRVETVALRDPLEEPFAYAQEWVESRTATLVRIETTGGTVGWGECWGPIAGNREVVEDLLGPELIGMDPTATSQIYDQIYGKGRAAFQSFVPLTAISGIDIALWDIRGKLQKSSVAELLGGLKTTTTPAYATGHYFKDTSNLEEQYRRIVDEAEQNAERFGAIKLKVGLEFLGYGIDEDIELVRRVRHAVGDDTKIMVDANYAYDLPTAREMLYELESLDVGWFEEPISPENIEGYAHLQGASNVSVAAGECHAPYEFDRLLDDHRIDIAQPDICNVGGFTPAQHITQLAKNQGIKVVPHVWGTSVAIAASLQLIGTLAGQTWLEFDRSPNILREDILDEGFEPDEGGLVQVPDGPGIGIELNEDRLREYAVSS